MLTGEIRQTTCAELFASRQTCLYNTVCIEQDTVARLERFGRYRHRCRIGERSEAPGHRRVTTQLADHSPAANQHRPRMSRVRPGHDSGVDVDPGQLSRGERVRELRSNSRVKVGMDLFERLALA